MTPGITVIVLGLMASVSAASSVTIHPIEITPTNQLEHHIVVEIPDLDLPAEIRPKNDPFYVRLVVPFTLDAKTLTRAQLYVKWPEHNIQVSLDTKRKGEFAITSFRLDASSFSNATVILDLQYDRRGEASATRAYSLKLDEYQKEKKTTQPAPRAVPSKDAADGAP